MRKFQQFKFWTVKDCLKVVDQLSQMPNLCGLESHSFAKNGSINRTNVSVPCKLYLRSISLNGIAGLKLPLVLKGQEIPKLQSSLTY